MTPRTMSAYRSDLDDDFNTVQSSLDKTGVGYSFAVGYRFSPSGGRSWSAGPVPLDRRYDGRRP